MKCDISEQLKQEFMSKCSTLENQFDEFRRASDFETSQIVKALQSDYEFELEKIRNEHQENIDRLKSEREKKEIFGRSIEMQTDERQTLEKQTSISLIRQDQLTQTNQSEFIDQTVQTSIEYDDQRRRIIIEQQKQFNLAVQRAVDNATTIHKQRIQQLEQRLEDKHFKIIKLKECIKKLQNFYTISSTPPTVTNSVMVSSLDDEQQTNSDEQSTTMFLKRSEPISVPSSVVAEDVSMAENVALSPTNK